MSDTGLASQTSRRRRNGESELVSIDSVHQNIHDGLFYTSRRNNAALANNASIDVLFRVVDGAHARVSASLGGDGAFLGYSGPTTTADGTAVPRNNRNRFSTNTAASLVFHTPAVSVVGTLLVEQYIFGGSGGKAIGSDIDTFLEWLLSPGDYLMRLTNTSGQVQRAGLALDWYERAV